MCSGELDSEHQFHSLMKQSKWTSFDHEDADFDRLDASTSPMKPDNRRYQYEDGVLGVNFLACDIQVEAYLAGCLLAEAISDFRIQRCSPSRGCPQRDGRASLERQSEDLDVRD
ncbi:8ac19d45-4a81-4114-8372-2f05a7ed2bc2 [Thermothielavioides terrestris]|uniref:8ac19d45-4a81-4114-8372-2f05a7ed2bc2 n=1 Tax=Thermothielavioides terrestris TaxID=2587410 RepID=A0A3S4BQF9_9PEZI|nr:8ac19d45-4a81-4114-8372-2f05a7ed2bc2 [Thermothielavioides terrestris]